MIYAPLFELSWTVIEEHLRSNAKVFMGDCRLRVKAQSIEFYVAGWQGELYHTNLGWFDDPLAAYDRMVDYPPYANRSVFSATESVLGAINSDPFARKTYNELMIGERV